MPDAHSKPTAAEVLREHWYANGVGYCVCGAGPAINHPQHQEDMLAAAGLLVTAEQAPGDVLLSLVESGLGWGRARAMLAEHDAQVWDEGFEAGHVWVPQTNGIPHDPPLNPHRADRIAAGGES